MADYNADVVIVGGGIAGCIMGWKLAESGASVIILEAGDKIDRNKSILAYMNDPNRNNDSPYPQVPNAPYPSMDNPNDYYIQKGPDNFQSNYIKALGGTTWHWLGTSLRFVPNDFRMKSEYGVMVDWPITYNDLEPWYNIAESTLPVSGNSEYDLGAPRSQPYMMGEIPMTYSDKVIQKAFENLTLPDDETKKLEVRGTPQGRNSKEFDGRAACCGSNNCIPMCPVGAKYDASVHAAKAETAGAKILTNTTATFIQTNEDAQVTGIKYKTPQGEGVAVGKVYVLAAHAIETPKLMLMSKDDRYPNGVGNSSDQVGRNLMDHNCVLSYGLTKDPVFPYRAPLSTAGVENVKDGAFRKNRAAFRIEIGNDGWSWPVGYPEFLAPWMLKQSGRVYHKNAPVGQETRETYKPEGADKEFYYGKDFRNMIKQNVEREIRFAFLVEQPPDPNNRIVPNFEQLDSFGLPRPEIHYSIDDYTKAGINVAVELQKKMLDALGATQQHHSWPYGAGHIVGTTRMGSDPKTSVVDAELRSHDHKNMFILGSNTFPTVAASNPTLTIVATTLRCVEAVQKQLKEME